MGLFTRKHKEKEIETPPVEERSCAEEEQSAGSASFSLARLFSGSYSYRSIPAVYACIELISNAISSIPLRVVSEDEHGHREVVKHHPLQRIFRNKTLQTMSMQTIIKSAIQDVLINGNGYIGIVRGESGIVTGLRYIPSSSCSPVYDQNRDVLYYLVSLLTDQNKKMKTDAKDIIHLTKDTREGVSGIPVSLFAKDTIELSKSSEAAAKDFFDSNMNVNGVLSCKAQTNKQQMADLKKSWTQSGQSSSLHVLPFGVDYFAIGTDAAKGQLLESRQYQTVQICQFYGVPLQLIQSGDKLTYNSLEQLNLLFFQHTLQPYIVNIESEFSRKLFWDDDNLVVDMDEDAFLLRTDKSSTATYLSTLVGGGIMTVNESRKQLGLCEIENGDELHIAYSDANKAKIGNETPDINQNEAQN